MPLFRKRQAPDSGFSVGVDDHRVVIGGAARGCEMLEEIDGYVSAVAERGSKRADGRDSIAVLNAKMDYAELVDGAVMVLALSLEELVSRGVLGEDECPQRPAPVRLLQDLATYEYIQGTYTRAAQRMVWVRSVDALLRERGIAVLRPLPPDQR